MPSSVIRDPDHWSHRRGGFDPKLDSGVFAVALVTLLLALASIVLAHPDPHDGAPLLGAVGLIAAWRYGWWMTHVLRARAYLRARFPELRAEADRTHASRRLGHVYAIVMSYRIEPADFLAVYGALIRNAIRYGAQTTIIAGITSERDKELLDRAWRDLGAPANVQIVSQYQKGDGKRSAMGMALRALARRAPAADSAVVFLDGDIVLGDEAFEKTFPLLIANPRIQALTTNNDALVRGDYLTRQWYRLRYAQRHVLMSSLSLSQRLLVLTGRFSIFRGAVAADPEFIRMVETDAVDHWRHGRIRFLSGDDKSTWHFLMKRSARMLYVPDVFAYGLEALPDPDRFLASATALMQRWFGNMLRANGRAVALGPRRTGYFLWWCLIDQRLSMWTSLIGPVSAMLLAATVAPVYLAYYFLWVIVSRLGMSLVVGKAWGNFSPAWPFLMYFNQLWGSALKVHLSFRLDRQKWNRQGIAIGGRAAAIDRWSTRLMQLAALAVLAYAVGLAASVLPGFDAAGFRLLQAGLFGR